MQRMSGIATYTKHLVKLVKHTKAKILDTRKTTPNLRPLEKWAVTIGGGTNHRFALYDMIMLKDNHIDFAGSLPEAVRRARQAAPHPLRIEVEVTTMDEVMETMEDIRAAGVSILTVGQYLQPSSKHRQWPRPPYHQSASFELCRVLIYQLRCVSPLQLLLHVSC